VGRRVDKVGRSDKVVVGFTVGINDNGDDENGIAGESEDGLKEGVDVAASDGSELAEGSSVGT